MRVTATQFSEVLLIEPECLRDNRGFFVETWQQQRYVALGLAAVTEQDNLSWSHQGVLRGLHFQHPRAQAKVVQALVGEIWDVAVDIRRGSPTFGRWTAAKLSADNQQQLYIPGGFAHGFCVVSNGALVAYKCSAVYDPANELGIAWDDPALGILWPTQCPILSAKDAGLPALRDLVEDRLPLYQSSLPDCI